MDISLTVCAYNAENRLPIVMDAILRQVLSDAISWEVVVVDNNSTDHTEEIAEAYVDKLSVPLKVVRETTQGLIYARRAAFNASSGKIISFLDDDTEPNARWIQKLYDFFEHHPRAGLVGPKITGVFECPPPSYLNEIKGALALTDLGEDPINLTDDKRGHPLYPHAGCRREAVVQLFNQKAFSITGRRGDELTSCEDTVLAFEVRRRGWDWWYEPGLNLTHHIPAGRLSQQYLKRLFFGLGQSAAFVDAAGKGQSLGICEVVAGLARHGIRWFYYSLRARLPLRARVGPVVCQLYAQNRLAGLLSYARYGVEACVGHRNLDR